MHEQNKFQPGDLVRLINEEGFSTEFAVGYIVSMRTCTDGVKRPTKRGKLFQKGMIGIVVAKNDNIFNNLVTVKLDCGYYTFTKFSLEFVK